VRGWDPVRAFALIERERIASAGGVPTIARQLAAPTDSVVMAAAAVGITNNTLGEEQGAVVTLKAGAPAKWIRAPSPPNSWSPSNLP
jgi:non-ribosomal peptide synthetase component E (peptide arylation enzyme)